MNLEVLIQEIKDFSKGTHGSTDYDKDKHYVMGENDAEYAPLGYLTKKFDQIESLDDLLRKGFVYDSYELFDRPHFQEWYERQFARRLKRSAQKSISILHSPNNKIIFDAVEQVNKSYETLKEQFVLLNNKNLPTQLGEWYAKCIFGLLQSRSPSQRGFDFHLKGKRTEVKVHWGDHSSPKGVKIRKSLLELSEYSIFIYIARNFMIREICFLDSNYVLRKFSGKGHTVFLKDTDISQYFFSKSDKHQDKIANSSALLKFSSPTLAMQLAERFQQTS